MTSYLERKTLRLEKMKQKHASLLLRYSNLLEQKQDPEIENKVSKQKEMFQKREDCYYKHIVKIDNNMKKRIWEIDLLRALVIVGILIDHLLIAFSTTFPAIFVDEQYFSYPFLQNMYDFSELYFYSVPRGIIRYIGITVLILLIGISSQFSRNNWKKSILLIFIGATISCIFLLGVHLGVVGYSLFGTLTCYGVCLLIYCIVHAIFSRFKKHWKWICLGIGLFILFAWRYVRFDNLDPDMEEKYNNFWLIFNGYSRCIVAVSDISDFDFITTLKMIIGINRFGTDYLGLFPTLGYLFVGAFIGQTVYKDKKSLLCYFDKEGKIPLNERFNHATRGLLFFGKRAIFFYLGHQIIYLGLALIIGGLILGLPFSFV